MKKLLNSKWTSLVNIKGWKHYQVRNVLIKKCLTIDFIDCIDSIYSNSTDSMDSIDSIDFIDSIDSIDL